jgi:hypothetical protein
MTQIAHDDGRKAFQVGRVYDPIFCDWFGLLWFNHWPVVEDIKGKSFCFIDTSCLFEIQFSLIFIYLLFY